MPRPTAKKFNTLLAACLLGAACAAPALAQSRDLSAAGAAGESLTPPRVGNVEKASTLLYYAVGIGCLALCVGVVVIPGRREQNEGA